MRTPGPPRSAPGRPPRRRGPLTFTVATTGALGEDILLARHGERILRLRQDHRSGQTVATLRDGTVDTAPNRIDGGTLALRPVERARLRWGALTGNGDPEAVRELRLLGRVSAAWILASLLLCALMTWGMATLLDPATAQELVAAYLGPAPTGIPDSAGTPADPASAGS